MTLRWRSRIAREALKHRRRRRPLIGSAPAEVVPVRLDPELRAAVEARATADQTTTSDVISDALCHFLDVARTPPTGRQSDGRDGKGTGSTGHCSVILELVHAEIDSSDAAVERLGNDIAAIFDELGLPHLAPVRVISAKPLDRGGHKLNGGLTLAHCAPSWPAMTRNRVVWYVGAPIDCDTRLLQCMG